MARRSRDDLFRLGLSLLRYKRAGAVLRLRFWTGRPAPFKLGSGAGLWWSPFALLFTPCTALSGGLLAWWNIRVQWVCAEECT
eukprot:2921276-Pyramimonas_sp.AAC.1